MAAASIGSGNNFSATNAQILWVTISPCFRFDFECQQCGLLCHCNHTWSHLLPGNSSIGPHADRLRRVEYNVNLNTPPIICEIWHSHRLCLAVIIALPAATPSSLKNSASYALGNFTNRNIYSIDHVSSPNSLIQLTGGRLATHLFWASLLQLGPSVRASGFRFCDSESFKVLSTLLCISVRKHQMLRQQFLGP